MNRSCLLLRLAVVLLAGSLSATAQKTVQSNLSVHWEELTGPDFIAAIRQAQGVCVLPFGIIEKHGPHLPLGTDLINVRFVTEKAAQQEYAVLFPAYYFGQIAEARSSQARSPTVRTCSSICCRRRRTRWRATAAGRS